MKSYRDVISDIRSMNKLLSSDSLANDRVIMQEIISAANLIVGQALQKRKYWQSPTLFTSVKCLEMEKIPLSQCCEYTGQKMVAISKESLPRIGEGIFGLAIQGVYGMAGENGMMKFSQTNPNRYSNLVKFNPHNINKFFWVRSDGRVMVTNEDTKLIDVYAYFTEPVPNTLLYPGENCDCMPKPLITDLCINPLDQQFHFIDERLFDLKQLVYKNLLSTYFNVKQDVTSNQLDESSK